MNTSEAIHSVSRRLYGLLRIAWWLVKRTWRSFETAIFTRARYSEPKMRWMGALGVFGFPAYYFVWAVLLPQPYESLGLRLFGSALFLPLLLVSFWPARLRAWLPLYWYLAMTFALLVSIAYSPLSIFVPIFLQGLHGFDPLAAGYTVAGASMGWTVSSIVVAGWSQRAAGRMLAVGPLAMAIGLGGIALLMATKPVLVLPMLIALVGLGIGACWGFGVQRLMGGAKSGEGDLAASAVATVQQTGFALGAAAAGIVATQAGLSRGLSTQGLASAAFWVPASFVAVAVIAAVAGGRLALLARRGQLL